MRRANPWIIPRNHRVEEALAAASDGDDLGPFEESAGNASYAEPAAADVTAGYRTFCGT